jgi:hypothetical protein
MGTRSPFVKISAVAALLFASLLAGCTSSTSGADPEGTEANDDLALTAAPVLYLNVTIGNETYRFTSADAAGGRGPGDATSNGTTTVSSGNGTSTKGNATGNGAGNATSGKAANTTTPGGDAPLEVSVSLEATQLPANQSLSWSIDFGDLGTNASAGNATGNSTTAPGSSTAGPGGGNGTGKASGMANGTKLPASAKHTYVEPGAYEIRSSLRQGNEVLGSLHVALLVGGNGTNSTHGLASGTEVGPAPVLEGEGSFDVGLVVLCEDADSFDWVIPATDEATGTPLALKDLVVTLSGGTTNLDADLEVYGPDGELIDESTGSSNAETVSAEGPFPAGTFRVVVVGCGGVAASFSVHGEGLLVAA